VETPSARVSELGLAQRQEICDEQRPGQHASTLPSRALYRNCRVARCCGGAAPPIPPGRLSHDHTASTPLYGIAGTGTPGQRPRPPLVGTLRDMDPRSNAEVAASPPSSGRGTRDAHRRRRIRRSEIEANVWRPAGIDGLELRHATYARIRSVPHLHETYCITLTERGTADVFLLGQVERTTPARVVALNPDEAHHGGPSGAERWECRSFYPTTECVRRLVSDSDDDPDLVVSAHVVDDSLTIALLRRAHSVCEQNTTQLARESALVAAFRRLFAPRSGADPRLSSSGKRGVVRLLREYIDAHAVEDMGLQYLAQLVGLTRYRVCTVFRQELGVSPHAYQLQRRVAIAREMLFGGAAIADVAKVTGFYDQPHFTRVFKRQAGITPGRYGIAPSPLSPPATRIKAI
jgi:AraC-like DNA-binding protein